MAAEDFRKSAKAPRNVCANETWAQAGKVMADLGRAVEDLLRRLDAERGHHDHVYDGTPGWGYTVFAPAYTGEGLREVLEFALDRDADIAVSVMLHGSKTQIYKGFDAEAAREVICDNITRSVNQEKAFACLRSQVPPICFLR